MDSLLRSASLGLETINNDDSFAKARIYALRDLCYVYKIKMILCNDMKIFRRTRADVNMKIIVDANNVDASIIENLNNVFNGLTISAEFYTYSSIENNPINKIFDSSYGIIYNEDCVVWQDEFEYYYKTAEEINSRIQEFKSLCDKYNIESAYATFDNVFTMTHHNSYDDEILRLVIDTPISIDEKNCRIDFRKFFAPRYFIDYYEDISFYVDIVNVYNKNIKDVDKYIQDIQKAVCIYQRSV